MRHAAPRSDTLDRRLNHAGELVFAGVAYTIGFAAVALMTLGSALAFWELWQWLGVD